MFRDSQRQILLDRQAPKEARDLKGASHTGLDSCGLRHSSRVTAANPDFTSTRLHPSTNQIDECRLTRAVGPDERTACALLKLKAHVASDLERSKALRETAGLQCRGRDKVRATRVRGCEVRGCDGWHHDCFGGRPTVTQSPSRP